MNRKVQTASRAEHDPDAYPLPDDTVPEPPESPHVASYIAEMTDELAKMAANSGLETVCYLLTLARLEAETVAQQADEEED